MSDTDNSEETNAQSGRRTLQLRKTVETGQVRQNFSHGRSKSVLVEVKRKRSFLKPEEAGEAAALAEAQAAAVPSRAAEAVAAPRSPAAAEVHDHLTEEERVARTKALKGAVKAAADDIRQSQELGAQRQAAERARREIEEKDAAEAAARKAEEDNRRSERKAAPSGVEALPILSIVDAEVEAERVARKTGEPKKGHAKPDIEAESEEEIRKGGKAAPAKAPARRIEERRRSGKLTVTAALSDEEGVRTRSLASLRRAREKEKRHQMMMMQQQQKQVREVVIPENITLQELANRMAERATEVIKTLMKMGVMATINETLDADTAELVVSEFGHKAKRVSESDVEIGVVGKADEARNLLPRPPVVTVMGHVDHGKTSLLDALRATDVALGESGGITQHIGAYQVNLAGGQKITFLDTPGHEAFSAMRSRGAKVTDIVVLVVAADDGVMPQTIEAIHHAQAANVPIIVAINKIDKHEANPDRVRKELLQYGIVVESLSGEVQEVEVSALKKMNLDKLEEAILLQAEILDLKANPNRSAEGVVVEAELDKGRGPVATVLINRGTLRVGDTFVAGAEWGRVRALFDERGKALENVGPAQPAVVLGLNNIPAAGDDFTVVENEAKAREVSAFRQREMQRRRHGLTERASLETMFSRMKEAKASDLPIVIKADVQGSAEAIVSALNSLSTEEVRAQILHAGVGAITEADISLAAASKAPVIGFNVRANKQALAMAAQDGVEIRYYSVIYNLVDDIKAAMSGLLKPEMRETILGTAEVLDVFSAGKAGKAAGCLVTNGFVRSGAMARLLRDDVVVYAGPLGSLRRFKDEVKEVKSGTECGMGFLTFTDIRKGDIVEVFEVEEITRTL
jgi:translation initiation factor IF-2